MYFDIIGEIESYDQGKRRTVICALHREQRM